MYTKIPSLVSCNPFGLGAISDKLIFDKVVFVRNRAMGPMHERVIVFC